MKARPWACGLLLLPLCLGEPPVLFLKTHKTGSTTVAAIVHRYAESRGLACFVPSPDLDSHIFDVGSGVDAALVARAGAPFGCWASHAIWHPRLLDLIGPGAPLVLSVVREPVSRFLSAWDFYGVGARVARDGHAPITLDAYVLSDKHNASDAPSPWAFNGMSTELVGRGYDAVALRARVDDIDAGRWTVLLLDQLDLSLVALLQNRHGWALEDVLYVTHNARKSARVAQPSARARAAIGALSADDAQLYAAAERALEAALAAFPGGRTAAVERAAALGDARGATAARCRALVNATVAEEASDAAPALSLDACRLMLMDDKAWTRHLRAPLFKASSEDAQREVLLAAAADLALGCALTTFESETIPCVAAQYGDERAARVIRPVRGRVEARGFACDADDVARDGDEAAIVLVRRGGGCGFAQKAANAQRAGYAAVLIADRPPPDEHRAAEPLLEPPGLGEAHGLTLPIAMIAHASAEMLHPSASPVEFALAPDTALDALSAVEVEQSLYGAIPSAGMFRPQNTGT